MPEIFLLKDLPRYEYLQEKAKRYPDLDAGAVDATLVLMRVASDVLEGLGHHFARHNTSQGRFLVLVLLDRVCQQGVILPSEIAEKLSVSRATITGLLDGLEKDGYIERQAHPDDRRALSIHLTECGKAFLEKVLPEHYRRVAGLMAHLSDDERRQLVALLTKVAQGKDALYEDLEPALQATNS